MTKKPLLLNKSIESNVLLSSLALIRLHTLFGNPCRISLEHCVAGSASDQFRE